jgi:hypothetical protein
MTDPKETMMRNMSKKGALLSAALAVTLLSGCACNLEERIDALETRVGAVEQTANDAMAAANRAQATADGAAAAAAAAQKTANDAVEAVSRMAEKCCRK